DISPAAIAMARFVVAHAIRDWTPPGGAEVDLLAGNSLREALPTADVVLMNPPFVSWPALSPEQRDTMRDVLGDRLEGRGDLSMAFVTRALDSVAVGGALGVLLPSSLLTTQSAVTWRAS